MIFVLFFGNFAQTYFVGTRKKSLIDATKYVQVSKTKKKHVNFCKPQLDLMKTGRVLRGPKLHGGVSMMGLILWMPGLFFMALILPLVRLKQSKTSKLYAFLDK